MRGLAAGAAITVLLMEIYPSTVAAAQSHLGVKANEIVVLQWECNVGTPTRILSDGTPISDFVIPRAHTLVITDLEWRVVVPSDTTGLNYLVEAHLRDENGFQSFPYLGLIKLLQARGYLSDHLTAGIALDASVTLDNDVQAPNPKFSLFGVAFGSGEAVDCKATLRGYLLK